MQRWVHSRGNYFLCGSFAQAIWTYISATRLCVSFVLFSFYISLKCFLFCFLSFFILTFSNVNAVIRIIFFSLSFFLHNRFSLLPFLLSTVFLFCLFVCFFLSFYHSFFLSFFLSLSPLSIFFPLFYLTVSPPSFFLLSNRFVFVILSFILTVFLFSYCVSVFFPCFFFFLCPFSYFLLLYLTFFPAFLLSFFLSVWPFSFFLSFFLSFFFDHHFILSFFLSNCYPSFHLLCYDHNKEPY
ncbi:unnamed protein product [Acanthosepion pharaonis]|uniref:Uncharacterized protein n=1 Tax=Acanthosepion pharaonis TaxID=158019 RepID=A0A812E2E8_ACAPH|nr:unnamed protein product [Sepia pharaonis]